MEQSKPRCQYIRAGGQRCRAHPLAESAFCFFHDPASTSHRNAARKAGGKKHGAAVLASTTPEHSLVTVSDVAHLIADTINQARRGELDPRVANCVGYLSGLLLKAMERGEVEARLAALEATVRPPSSSVSHDFDIEPDESILLGELEGA